jgi:hypothetical protein
MVVSSGALEGDMMAIVSPAFNAIGITIGC